MSKWAYISIDNSEPDLKSLVSASILAFDVEGTGMNIGSSEPIGFSLACSSKNGYYSPIENHFFKSLLALNKLYLAHNAVYDRSMMKKAGVVVDNLADTMVAAHLLEKPGLSLKALSNLPVRSFSELENGFANMSILEIGEYSCPHSMATFDLWKALEGQLKNLGLLNIFKNIEMPLVPVLSDMELNGVMISQEVLKELGRLFDEKIATLKEALDYWAGESRVNFNSPDQVADIFFNKLKIPPHPWMRTSTGRPTTLAKYLEQVKDKHPIIPIYLSYKQLMTLKNSYVNSLSRDIQADGRVYGSFNQTNTRTGRLSSSGPNLQKIPVRTELGKKIRTAFVAPPGEKLLKADYDLLELKVLAICSKNYHMLRAFKEDRDIHEETAIRIFKDKSRRSEGKTRNFQIVYGGGEASERDAFFVAYPGIREWIESTYKQAREAEYVRTLNGRIRTIPEYIYQRGNLLFSDKALAHGDKEVVSTLVQGTSAEEVKVGMRKVWEKTRDTDVKMLMQVHDEVVFEVPEQIIMDVARLVKEEMTIHKYEIPLTVSIEIGDNWGEMTKLEV